MPITVPIHSEKPLADGAIIARLKALSTAILSDVMDRWPGAPGLMPIGGPPKGGTMAGTAMTVRTRQGDNVVVHAALDLIRPGEVLVVAAGGSTERAIVGGIMGTYAAKRGAAGIVIDGAVRDASHMYRSAPPTFAKAISHLGPYKSGPGALRGTVCIAGVVVNDGDYIIGDEDGVGVIPRTMVHDVVAAGEAKVRQEARELAEIERGTWDRRWVREAVTLAPMSEGA